MSKNTKIIAKIVLSISNTELSFDEARKLKFTNYRANALEYSELNAIERKTVIENIVKENAKMNARSIQNDFAKLVTALENNLNLDLYSSFKSVERANKQIADGVAIVPKSGVNEGMAKVVIKKETEKRNNDTEILSAKNEAIDLIKADAKFIEFLAYAKEQKMDLAHLRLAIK